MGHLVPFHQDHPSRYSPHRLAPIPEATPMTTRTRLLVPVLLLAVLVAACGGPSTPSPAPSSAAPTARPTPTPTATPSPSPTASAAPAADISLVTDAVDKTLGTETARLAMTITFDGGTAIPPGTTFGGNGQVGFGEPRQATLAMDFSALGLGELEMIIDDTIVYLRGAAFASLAPENGWVRIDLESDHPNAAAFQGIASGSNDASLSLYYLYGGTAEPEQVGTATIDKKKTRQFHMPVDLDIALERVPAAIRDALLLNVGEMRDTGVTPQLGSDVWIDDDGLIRRVDYTYNLSSLSGGGTMTAGFHLSKFGEPLELGVPAVADTIDIEDVQLGG
jgi:hypothetical protein